MGGADPALSRARHSRPNANLRPLCTADGKRASRQRLLGNPAAATDARAKANASPPKARPQPPPVKETIHEKTQSSKRHLADGVSRRLRAKQAATRKTLNAATGEPRAETLHRKGSPCETNRAKLKSHPGHIGRRAAKRTERETEHTNYAKKVARSAREQSEKREKRRQANRRLKH